MMGLRPRRSSDPEVNTHAAKIHGCSYAWALLSRILLATSWYRWRLLPSVSALCRGVQVRLGNHAPDRARGACQARGGHPAEPSAREASVMGAACPSPEARYSF